jgi:hypothetical protein
MRLDEVFERIRGRLGDEPFDGDLPRAWPEPADSFFGPSPAPESNS